MLFSKFAYHLFIEMRDDASSLVTFDELIKRIDVENGLPIEENILDDIDVVERIFKEVSSFED